MSEQPRLNLNDMTAQELYDMLQTPGCLHTNILRGLFTLPRMDALHIAGATDYDSLRAENARLRDLIERSNLEEVDGFTADGPTLKKDGRILISKDLANQEQRITEALATAAKHARENARLVEWLRGIATIPSDLQLAQAMADDALRGERLSEILADDNKKDTP